jgi:hypothetical protein
MNRLPRSALQPKHHGEDRPPSDRESAIVAEYLSRLRELKPLWNRNILLLFLPGFLLFAAGGPGGLLLPGGHANRNLWLIVPGIALCAIGAFRGVRLMLKYRRCPVCDRFQSVEIRIPYRTCTGCGARLTHNWKETS